MPGLLHRNRSLIRRGRAVVVASAACREKCCTDTVHTYCLVCPCNLEGCWPDHLSYWVRDDVRCTVPGGEPGGGPLVCDGDTTIRIRPVGSGDAGNWCYQRVGHISRLEADLPPGARKIDPHTHIEITCTSGCDDPLCIPAGQTGECPCGCDEVCYGLVPALGMAGDCNGSWFCCGGKLDEEGNATFDWFHTGTLRKGHDWIVKTSDAACSQNPCGTVFNGEYQTITITTGEVVSRNGCEVCKEVFYTATFPGGPPTTPPCDTPNPPSETVSRYVVCRGYADGLTGAYPYSTLDEHREPDPFGCGEQGWRIAESETRSCTVSRHQRSSELWSVGSVDGVTCNCYLRDWELDDESVVYVAGGDSEGCCDGCKQEICGGVMGGGGCDHGGDVGEIPVTSPAGAVSPLGRPVVGSVGEFF